MISILEKGYTQGFKNSNYILSAFKLFDRSPNKYRVLSNGISFNLRRHLSSNRDITPVQSGGTGDILTQTFRSATTVDHVLEAVNKHFAIMNNRQAMAALRSIFALQKSNCTSLDKEDVVNSKEFESLCNQIKKQSRSMELNSLIESLKVITYFEVPSTSAMVQTILHLIKHQVNDLSLQQIVFLHFLCDKLQKNPIVDALDIALPLVFEANVKQKLNRDNLSQLAQMLKYASQKRVSESCIEEIVHAISLNQDELQGRVAFQIALGMLSMIKYDPMYVTLAQNAMNALSSNVNKVGYKEMSYLLEKLSEKCSRHRDYYNEDFVDKCVESIIQHNISFHNAAWTLKRLSKLGHTSLELLDYIAEQIQREPQVLRNCSLTYLFALPTGFANMDYKPKNWDQIQQLILESYQSMPKDNIYLPWVKFALDLASLDCFDDHLLQHVFNASFLEKFLGRENNMLDHLQLLSLYQSVKSLYPEYEGPFPPDEVLERAKEIIGENVKEFPLQGALEKGLGGALYVQTKSYTKMGHFIDHIVAVRRGGYPVALNQLVEEKSTKRVYLEDFKLPPDSQIVLVLAIQAGSYSLNGKRLRRSIAIKEKTLEALGYAVIPISIEDWKNLPDYEKIPFLMQSIRLKAVDQFEDKNSL